MKCHLVSIKLATMHSLTITTNISEFIDYTHAAERFMGYWFMTRMVSRSGLQYVDDEGRE